MAAWVCSLGSRARNAVCSGWAVEGSKELVDAIRGTASWETAPRRGRSCRETRTAPATCGGYERPTLTGRTSSRPRERPPGGRPRGLLPLASDRQDYALSPNLRLAKRFFE